MVSLDQIGYGAGTAENSTPNLLRILIGEARDELRGYETERIAVLETNIDDMNPQMYDYLMEKLLGMGALDVFLSPVQMKKNRPGTLVTVTCPPHLLERLTEYLLLETTTIGLRWRVDNRLKARRTIHKLDTQYGSIRYKVAEVGKGITNIAPEYEDCKRVALEHNIPLKEVMDKVRALICAS